MRRACNQVMELDVEISERGGFVCSFHDPRKFLQSPDVYPSSAGGRSSSDRWFDSRSEVDDLEQAPIREIHQRKKVSTEVFAVRVDNHRASTGPTLNQSLQFESLKCFSQ